MSDHALRVACIWNQPGAPVGALAHGAHIGTWSLAAVCGYDVMYWPNDGQPPASIHDYDVLLVNLFGGMRHIEQIKGAGYEGAVVAIPDSYFSDLFRQENPLGEIFLKQLQASDVLGVVSESNRRFYGAMLEKPTVHIPHPIGTSAFFDAERQVKRKARILITGHSDAGHRRPLDYDLPTIATAGAIQRETGLPIVYVSADESAKTYCAQLGLVVSYLPRMVYEDYVRVSAHSYIGVDMYAIHGMGRNEITWAYAGLPFVAGNYTNGVGGDRFDPWNVESAAEYGIDLVNQRVLYERVQRTNLETVRSKHTFEHVKAEMVREMKGIAHARRQSLRA